MAGISVAVEKRGGIVLAVGNPHPPDPVRIKPHRGIARRQIFARGGEPGVEDVEVPPGIVPHRIARRTRSQRPVVARAGRAELQHLGVERLALENQLFCELIAETIAERGQSRIPAEILDTVAARRDAAHIATADGRPPLPRLHILDVLDERHDDRASFVVRQVIVDPVVGTERIETGMRIPVDRPPIGQRFVVALDVRPQHRLRLLEEYALAREAPRERALRRLRSPLVDRRDARVDAVDGQALAVDRLPRPRADGIRRILAASPDQGLPRRRSRSLRPFDQLRPHLGIEEHAGMVLADPSQPLGLRHRPGSHADSRKKNPHHHERFSHGTNWISTRVIEPERRPSSSPQDET